MVGLGVFTGFSYNARKDDLASFECKLFINIFNIKIAILLCLEPLKLMLNYSTSFKSLNSQSTLG